ncbi:MAG TPA: 2-hydroxyacyl-CoA dehydratase [Clostridia bacterium]|nr:2-hydroxyacyl-CoA dehydratase [Clostridia bacterium]
MKTEDPAARLGAAYEVLARAYRNRHERALQWKEQGGRVLACLGSDVPEELVLAAGYLPVRVCGEPGQATPLADRYLELAFEPTARSKFNRLLDGTYAYADGLVISNSTDVLVRLYFYLRELHRVEPEIELPPFYFLDLLFMPSMISSEYNLGTLRSFQRILEEWSGQEITPDQLQEAIRLCNENRALLRQLAELRRGTAPRVTGVEALTIIGASLLMPKEEHNRLLCEILDKARRLPPLEGVRLFVTGSVHEQTDFYELIEACGGIVVGEDHDWGNRHFHTDVATDVEPLAAIRDRYHLRLASPNKHLVSHRVRALLDQVQECGAEGVVFFMRTYDEASTWDYPEQHQILESLGIPSKLFVRQPYTLANRRQLMEDITELVAQVRAGRRE